METTTDESSESDRKWSLQTPRPVCSAPGKVTSHEWTKTYFYTAKLRVYTAIYTYLTFCNLENTWNRMTKTHHRVTKRLSHIFSIFFIADNKNNDNTLLCKRVKNPNNPSIVFASGFTKLIFLWKGRKQNNVRSLLSFYARRGRRIVGKKSQLRSSISPALSKWNGGIFLEFKLHLCYVGSIQSLVHYTSWGRNICLPEHSSWNLETTLHNQYVAGPDLERQAVMVWLPR